MSPNFCESCGPPRKAEFIVSRVSNSGSRCESCLCEGCARDSELVLFGNNGLPLTELLRVLVTERATDKNEQNRTKVCPGCGNTIEEVREAAVAGCSMCYTVFKADIENVISILNGSPGKPV